MSANSRVNSESSFTNPEIQWDIRVLFQPWYPCQLDLRVYLYPDIHTGLQLCNAYITLHGDPIVGICPKLAQAREKCNSIRKDTGYYLASSPFYNIKIPY